MQTASRLVEAEASASTQEKELDLLRTMVNSMQTENSQLKRQMKQSNDQRQMCYQGPGNPVGSGVRIEQVDTDPRSRKRSRDGSDPL